MSCTMISINSIVFRPPSPPTYADTGGETLFNRPNLSPNSVFYITPDFLPSNDSPCSPLSHFLNPPEEEQQCICAFYSRAPKSTKTTFIYSHGNGEDIGQVKKWMMYISRKLCVNTLAYDTQGYGLSNNTPSEEHYYSDIRLVFKFLTDVMEVPTNEIVLYGRSLGTGPTTDLFAECCQKKIQLKGIILQSALLSAVKTKFSMFTIPDIVIADMMKNGEKFSKISRLPLFKRTPVLFIHGMLDGVVPYSHTTQLWETRLSAIDVADVKLYSRFISLADSGHNDCEGLFLEEMVYEFRKFIVERDIEEIRKRSCHRTYTSTKKP